ncbi:MAG: branched-chain amino acid ABC transporter permease [Candidatus Dormibacteraeota bacterium]|nr:branched-chain amino acid ABC transporter permease [Candidatus Dormibacteraeota bacterium]
MAIPVQTLFSSLVNGSVFALMGVAIVLCYRSSRVVNLAQGETYTVTGLLTAKLVTVGFPLLAAGVCGIAAAAVGALLFERFALRSRLHWNPGRLIMVALGVALLVEGVANLLAGADQYSFPALLQGQPFTFSGAAFSQQDMLLVGVTLVVTAGLVLFFRHTLLGQAMTASAENPQASGLLGINVVRMRQLSFGFAGVLGGIAALLVVPLNSVTYGAGLSMTLSGFAAAAVADMQHPGRALWAGMALGLGEGYVGAYINPLLQVPLAFGVLLLAGVVYLSRNVRYGGVARA